MTDQRLVQCGAAAGILFVPLFVAAMTVPAIAGVPAITTPDAAFITALAAAAFAVRATAFLWGLIGLAFFCFASALYCTLRRVEGASAWLSLTAFTAGALWVFTAVLTVLLWHAATVSDPTAKFVGGIKTILLLVGNLHFSHDLLLVAILMGASALAIREHRTLPRWLV